MGFNDDTSDESVALLSSPPRYSENDSTTTSASVRELNITPLQQQPGSISNQLRIRDKNKNHSNDSDDATNTTTTSSRYSTFEQESPEEKAEIKKNKHKTTWQKIAAVIVFVLSIGAIFAVGTFMVNEYMHDILHWHSELMHWEGIMVYSALYLAVSFPFFIGYAILNVGAGYLYGMGEGLGVTMAAVMVSSLIAHITLRMCCSRCTKAAKRRSGSYTEIVKIMEGDQAIKIITMTRMSALPLGMQNALFATSDVPIWKLLIATLLGLGPLAALWVYFGTTLHTLADVVQTRKSGHDETIVLFVFEVLIMVFITVFIRHHIKKNIDKRVQEQKNLDGEDGSDRDSSNGQDDDDDESRRRVHDTTFAAMSGVTYLSTAQDIAFRPTSPPTTTITPETLPLIDKTSSTSQPTPHEPVLTRNLKHDFDAATNV